MGDSEEENEKDLGSGLNITGFLFGNIDDNGQLEDDILDPEAKQHLASLGRLGLSSFINEMMLSDCTADEKGRNKTDDEDEQTENQNGTSNDTDIDYLAKSPTALDFSDINELADDANDENCWYLQRIFCIGWFGRFVQFLTDLLKYIYVLR